MSALKLPCGYPNQLGRRSSISQRPQAALYCKYKAHYAGPDRAHEPTDLRPPAYLSPSTACRNEPACLQSVCTMPDLNLDRDVRLTTNQVEIEVRGCP